MLQQSAVPYSCPRQPAELGGGGGRAGSKAFTSMIAFEKGRRRTVIMFPSRQRRLGVRSTVGDYDYQYISKVSVLNLFVWMAFLQKRSSKKQAKMASCNVALSRALIFNSLMEIYYSENNLMALLKPLHSTGFWTWTRLLLHTNDIYLLTSAVGLFFYIYIY